jgi:hypothetical protein
LREWYWLLGEYATRAAQQLFSWAFWLLQCFLSRTIFEPVTRAARRVGLLPRPLSWVIVDVQPGADPPTPDALDWSKRASTLQLDSLKEIRGGAEKWAGSLTAVTGALGIVAIIKGPEKIEDLTSRYQIIVAVLLAIGTLLMLRGIVLAALAAQGTPGRIEFTGPTLRDFTAREAEEAADLLRFSRVVTVIGVLVAGIAVALVWFGPEAKKPPSMRMVIRDNGTMVCGELTTGSDDNVLVAGQPIRIAEIRSIIAVQECPDP